MRVNAIPTIKQTLFRREGFNVTGRIMKIFSLSIATLIGAVLSVASLASPPSAPTGLCLQTSDGTQCATEQSSDEAAGLFPGTNLKFRPGFIVSSSENQSVAAIEGRWQELFTASPNRKVSYRPAGVYGGVVRRLKWFRFYENENVRPANPKDYKDPAYNWSLLDSIFTINAVKNEGALVFIDALDVGFGSKAAPAWLINSPYNGVFSDVTGGASGAGRNIPKYYRYAGPDSRGLKNVGGSLPIVEEFVAFHQAMRDHLIATGNIDKVMGIKLEEMYVGATTPSDYDATDFFNGVGLRGKLISEIWEKSQVPVYMLSVNGGSTMKNILWNYVGTSSLGLGSPDMKLTDISDPGVSRFSHPDGTYQKDARPLIQATEGNGIREFTYFASGIPNPWGYSNITMPQTASHILWTLSGSPKSAKKDSGLGQAGTDPAGPMPVHTIILSWGTSSLDYAPTIEQWHTAIDTFGPPGTFAFPYLPPGYTP